MVVQVLLLFAFPLLPPLFPSLPRGRETHHVLDMKMVALFKSSNQISLVAVFHLVADRK